MAINPSWEAGRAELEQLMRGMMVQEEGWDIPAALRSRLQDIKDKGNWETDRKVYVFGQLDADKSIALAREGLIEWWPVLSGHAYFGDVAGMKKAYEALTADPGKSGKPGLSSAMTWIAQPYSLGEGPKRDPDAAALRLLLEWGADANYKDGAHFGHALRNADTPVIAAFIDHGGSVAKVAAVKAELLADKKMEQLERIDAALAGRHVFTKLDDNTLVSTDFLKEPGGLITLRKIFNFATERVNEIYETGAGPAARTAMSASPFRDYSDSELRQAQEKLEQLGGRPADPLGKKRLSLGSPS